MTVITTTDVTTGLSIAYIDYEDGGFDSSNLTLLQNGFGGLIEMSGSVEKVFLSGADNSFLNTPKTFKAMYAEYCVSLSEAVTFRNVLVFVPRVSSIRQNVSGTTTVFINGGSIEVSQNFSAVVNLFTLFTMP